MARYYWEFQVERYNTPDEWIPFGGWCEAASEAGARKADAWKVRYAEHHGRKWRIVRKDKVTPPLFTLSIPLG